MMRALVLASLLLLGRDALAQELPDAEPHAGRELRDPDFRVSTRQFGLERRVEMLQWRSDADGYQHVWNAAWIDSSVFDEAHQNPPALPIESERWWSQDATLAGQPIAPEVLQVLGVWRVFRPGFSRLPANLAATFQPEGDGLSSTENPLDPQVGDLRIRWRELTLPPLDGKVELRGGAWHLVPDSALPSQMDASPTVANASTRNESVRRLWPWFVAVLLPIAAVVVVRRRRAKSKH